MSKPSVRTIGWTLALSLALAGASGCAARRASLVREAHLARALESARTGCYRCLEEALDIYERIAAASRPPATAIRGAFDTALLLALRSRELGLPSNAALERARAWAAKLVTPGESSRLEPRVYLDAVDLVAGELSGLDAEPRQDITRRLRLSADVSPMTLEARREIEPARSADLVAEYLAVAIDCERTVSRPGIRGSEIRQRHGDPPLLRFKLASCGAEPSLLSPLREADPRWVDTLFFEGRRQMAARPVADVGRAAELFAAARAEFPDSHAITLALAAAQNALGEHAEALASFDAVLESERTHRDALLGRVTSLSYLDRHTEAVASATRMIELGTWHVGDAYYWRAWNRYHIYALESAWADVEQATRLLVNTSVYTLAGFIAYARKELETAIDRFDRAFKMDNTNCEAAWTAALVHVDQQAWADGAPRFSRAMECFVAAAATARTDIDSIRAASYAETLKARRIAAAEKRVETAEHRRAQSAFNAAQCYLRLGHRSAALAHLDVAAGHMLLREKAATLRPAIEKLPQ